MIAAFQTTRSVTLNLFQGLLIGLRQKGAGQQDRSAGVFSLDPARAARWMLNQVQHDAFGLSNRLRGAKIAKLMKGISNA